MQREAPSRRPRDPGRRPEKERRMHYLIEHIAPAAATLTPGQDDGAYPDFIAVAMTPAEAEEIVSERVGERVAFSDGVEGELRGEFGCVRFAPAG